MLFIISKIGAYLIAYTMFIVIEFPFFAITALFLPIMRKLKNIVPAINLILTAIKICLAILVADLFISLIGQTSSWLMFIIPGYYMVHNDLMNIRQIKYGQSNVKLMLASNNELDSYDPKNHLQLHQAYLIGDVLGWTIGTNLILQTASFF